MVVTAFLAEENIFLRFYSGSFCVSRVRLDSHADIGKACIVYKLRVCNSIIQKSKSAGYRLIYLVELPTSILLLTIYSNSDREDTGANEI